MIFIVFALAGIALAGLVIGLVMIVVAVTACWFVIAWPIGVIAYLCWCARKRPSAPAQARPERFGEFHYPLDVPVRHLCSHVPIRPPRRARPPMPSAMDNPTWL